eukprot:2006278-Prymnesium_polylepis.1
MRVAGVVLARRMLSRRVGGRSCICCGCGTASQRRLTSEQRSDDGVDSCAEVRRAAVQPRSA